VPTARSFRLSLAVALCCAGPLAAQEIVPDTLAARRAGDVVTVEGMVHDVHVSSHRKTTFMNFGAAYPHSTFAAWVPGSVGTRIAGVNGLAGRRVRVTGLVWLQDGKLPAITVTDPGQLEPVP
jgi:hypothetical protein